MKVSRAFLWMSIRSPRNVIAQHNQHLWFWSNGQPIEMSQLPIPLRKVFLEEHSQKASSPDPKLTAPRSCLSWALGGLPNVPRGTPSHAGSPKKPYFRPLSPLGY